MAKTYLKEYNTIFTEEKSSFTDYDVQLLSNIISNTSQQVLL
jgi:hypothetical protein